MRVRRGAKPTRPTTSVGTPQSSELKRGQSTPPSACLAGHIGIFRLSEQRLTARCINQTGTCSTSRVRADQPRSARIVNRLRHPSKRQRPSIRITLRCRARRISPQQSFPEPGTGCWREAPWASGAPRCHQHNSPWQKHGPATRLLHL